MRSSVSGRVLPYERGRGLRETSCSALTPQGRNTSRAVGQQPGLEGTSCPAGPLLSLGATCLAEGALGETGCVHPLRPLLGAVALPAPCAMGGQPGPGEAPQATRELNPTSSATVPTPQRTDQPPKSRPTESRLGTGPLGWGWSLIPKRTQVQWPGPRRGSIPASGAHLSWLGGRVRMRRFHMPWWCRDCHEVPAQGRGAPQGFGGGALHELEEKNPLAV